MKQDYSIDIVLPWVDGSDSAWLAERERYAGEAAVSMVDASSARYRDTGILRYLLRSIEQNMPWVRTVHFVTWGHLPTWLDPDAEGLHIVRHEEFIPETYLPTFSSHTIELNMHRILGLADHFIYFNDDMLALKPTKPGDFFVDGLPTDYAVETALHGKYFRSIAGVTLSDVEIINQNFRKRAVLRKNPGKWFNIRYGKEMLKTLFLLPWPFFSDFSYGHTANPYLKETFVTVWDKEFQALDETCQHRFRVVNDVNQWLMRDWQLVSGKFAPRSPGYAKNCNLTDDLTEIRREVEGKKHHVICINDVSYVMISNYDRVVEELNAILEMAFPKPSRFEKKHSAVSGKL